MNRKTFIHTCGLACIAGLWESCGAGKVLNGIISGSDLVIPVSDFETAKHGEKQYKHYVVVQHEQLQYPICVYRFSDSDYSALLMRCPHQGAELGVFGDKLQCPAHGSEFDHKGMVQNGPADTNLRTFPVTIINNNLNISLK